MKQLLIKPQIDQFDSVATFCKENQIGQDTDFIFIDRFLKEKFDPDLVAKADFHYFQDYGSGEPTDQIIDQVLAQVKKKNYQRIIAVGGGSVLDIAKILALKVPQEGSVVSLFDKSVEAIKAKELILVPSTCGTGSEVTNISIAEITAKNTKMGLAVDALYADRAVLVPELINTLPQKVLAASAIDALVHAMESFVAPRSNDFTELFAAQAIKLIIENFQIITEKGFSELKNCSEAFLRASCYAGIAFGNTGVGAVHALSYPLGGKYHVPHGESNYLFLVEIFKLYQRKAPQGKIQKLNQLLAEIFGLSSNQDVYLELSKLLDQLLEKKKLNTYGMEKSEVQSFSNLVLETQQRLLVNNYVHLEQSEIEEVYQKLY